ncbi:MAG: hypothetical protein ITF98_06540 [Fermentimonas sp.]|nr:hypothetical protein [Fermentimonas sp.]
MKFKSLLLLLAISISLHSQEPKGILHYVFPEFQQGVVLLKNGVSYNSKLNYNIATEEMLFDDNGTILAIGEEILPQIDTVFISNNKFIRVNNKFVKILIEEPSINLFIEHKCRIIPPSKPAAYGGTSQISSTTSYSSILSGGKMYSLTLPEDYEVVPYNVYWIEKNGQLKSFSSIGQLKKIYKDKRKVLNDYLKAIEVKPEDVKSVEEVIIYMEIN